MKIKEIRALTGLSQVKFANAYGIPVPTLENWERGTRSCPGYVLDLLEFKVKYDVENGGFKTMKIWKVYAQNVRTAPGSAVTEISEAQARDLIIEHLGFKAELINFPEDAEDDVVNEIFERFYSAGIADFEKWGFYGCGDFDIVKAEEMPARSNMAGDDMPDGF